MMITQEILELSKVASLRKALESWGRIVHWGLSPAPAPDQLTVYFTGLRQGWNLLALIDT